MSNQQEQLAFIQSLEIPTHAQAEPQTDSPVALGLSAPRVPFSGEPYPKRQEDPSAAVVNTGIMSFVSGMSLQNRQDAQNSTLLMSLAASKKFDPERQREQWYQFYTEGLNKLGWNVSSRASQLYTPSSTEFTLEDVALEIIAAVAGGGGYLPIAKLAFQALRNNGEALNVFQNNIHSETAGAFQIMPCAESPEGDALMVMNCLQFTKSVKTRRVLFFNFRSEEIRIYRAAQQTVLNQQVYASVRNAVLDKLGQGADDFITGLEI